MYDVITDGMVQLSPQMINARHGKRHLSLIIVLGSCGIYQLQEYHYELGANRYP